MATIQNEKVAIQYGQRFLHTNMAAVSSDKMNAPMQDANHVTQSSHFYPQSNQTPVNKEPIVLNHAINNMGAPNVVSSVLSGLNQSQMQHQSAQHQMQPPTSKLWLLVEWEAAAGEPNSYSVIDSTDLILHSPSGNSRETIHTGKNILVRRGKKLQQATVVIISDDKQFIDTEVRQLRKMAAENLYKNSVQKQHSASANQEQQPAKRRRTERFMTPSDEQEPASPEYEPMPTQSQIATANWVNNCKNERIVSPSPSVVSVQGSKPTTVFAKPPPMTFDQQTQTDTRFFPQDNNRSNQPELTKILSLLETILTEQKSMRMETEYNRKLTFDMMEQQNAFSETLKHLVAKVDVVNKFEITEVLKEPVDHVSNYVVLGTGGEESRDRASSIAESTVHRPTNSNDSANLVIENMSAQEESNMSYSQGKFAVHDESSVNSVSSTPKNLNFSNKLSSSALSLSNVSIQSQISNNTPENNKSAAINEMLKEWNDDDGGDDSDLTPIGPNNTMVKKQVLRAINWTNYKAATRKLLMTLFSREILATHTLTGRPSPAFMGDRAKPVKDKLDQRVINDIISIVSKTCRVSEAMVRTAITTKCADENKMSRMKHNRSGVSQTLALDISAVCGGVSDIESSMVGDENDTGEPFPRKVKRENKENVH